MAARSSRPDARRDVIVSRPNKTGPEFSRSAKPAALGKLVRKTDFDAVYRHGKRRSSSHFIVFAKTNDLPQSRFGLSIKRGLGGAVVRNRIRRRIREVVRLHRQEISAGWDIVIHPKPNVATAPITVLTSELLQLLKNP